MLPDVDQIADVVVEVIREAVAPLTVRVEALEGTVTPSPDLDAIAVKAAALIPVTKDGRDGVDAVLDVEALVTRVAALVPSPKDGVAGKDADIEALKQWISTEVERRVEVIKESLRLSVAASVVDAVERIPVPKDGRDGADAPLPDLDAIASKAAALIPVPKDGQPGPSGPVGPSGERGIDGTSVEPEDVAALVTKAVEAIPKAADGKAGANGVGLAGALIDRVGDLVLTLSDGSAKSLGRVVGQDVDMSLVAKQITEALAQWPRPKDGADGLGFEDLLFVSDEHGRLSAKFMRGELVKEVRLPGIVDRGVYREGVQYEKGDGTTWAGSFWIAQEKTTAKPGDSTVTSRAWRLAVKKGGEGKPGIGGKNGLDGKNGRAGLDLTQMLSDGTKYR